MLLTRYLKHQLIWIVAAIVFNLVSLWRMSQGGEPLSPTKPMVGMILFIGFTFVVGLGWKGYLKSYLLVTSLFTVVIAYGGVLLHFINMFGSNGLESYASIWVWCIGVSINTYGVLVSALALREAIKILRSTTIVE